VLQEAQGAIYYEILISYGTIELRAELGRERWTNLYEIKIDIENGHGLTGAGKCVD
jgi:hypothetical protein